MKPALLAALLSVRAAHAAIQADLVVIEGDDPARVLPALAALSEPSRPPTCTGPPNNMTCTMSESAARLPPVLLYDPGKHRAAQRLLDQLSPRSVLVVGSAGRPDPPLDYHRARRSAIRAGDESLAFALAARAFRKAPRLWLADEGDGARSVLMAALAALDPAPLLFLRGADGPPSRLAAAGALSRKLGAHEVVYSGVAAAAVAAWAREGGLSLAPAGDPADLVERYARRLAELGAAPAVAVVNPADLHGHFSPSRLSMLAPLWSLAWRAPIALAPADPDRAERAALDLIERLAPRARAVAWIGDPLALPMREMADPDPEGDPRRPAAPPRTFPVPLLSAEPADLASARLAAEDAFDLSLMLARALHLAPPRSGRALMLANADQRFILGEAISRATAKDLANAGLAVREVYGEEVTRARVRREIQGQALVIWEGHPRDLAVDEEEGIIDQALSPGLVLLQGCYTLDRSDPAVLVQQGAAAVVGTYMAVYSASGSAFAKALLDALLYRGDDLGTAAVHARNYLFALSRMAQASGHADWIKAQRAALSFDVWGDPLWRPVARAAPRLPAVSVQRDGLTLTVTVPRAKLEAVQAGPYRVQVVPGAQLSGIVRQGLEDSRIVRPFYFAAAELPEWTRAPRLAAGPLAEDLALTWAPRRRLLYVLLHPTALRGAKDGRITMTLEPPP